MFFFLSKVLQFLLTPVAWIFAGLIWAVLTKKVNLRKRLILAVTVLTFVFGNSFLVNEVYLMWECPPKTKLSKEHYKVGIVLGGMSVYDDQHQIIYFRSAHDRMLKAVDLYHQGVIDKILVTSGSGSIAHPDIKEAINIQNFWIQNGIRQKDLWVESESRNTRENALMSADFLKEKGIDSGPFLLFTSAFHMKRSLGCFEKAGLNVEAFPADRYSGDRHFNLDHLLVPNVQAFERWTLIIHEIAGYLIYKMRGFC
jgi:uncharacterized SAM-binding protein YcdF (DUF218 family)